MRTVRLFPMLREQTAQFARHLAYERERQHLQHFLADHAEQASGIAVARGCRLEWDRVRPLLSAPIHSVGRFDIVGEHPPHEAALIGCKHDLTVVVWWSGHGDGEAG